MNKQKGFSLVEGLLIVLIVSVVGFGGYTVWNNNQDESIIEKVDTTEADDNYDNEKKANTNDNNMFLNSEFGFALEYPSSLKATQVSTYDGYEGLGRSMNFTIDDDIYISSNTNDYNIGPKGPVPLSGLLANGYVDSDTVLYYADGESELSADRIERRDSFLYIENRILFQGGDNPTEYIALFNTTKGGLVIYTENPDKIALIEKIAKTVSIN